MAYGCGALVDTYDPARRVRIIEGMPPLRVRLKSSIDQLTRFRLRLN
jgi:hypothetical protein